MAKDRYSLGVISGFVGGLAATVVNLVLILLLNYGNWFSIRRSSFHPPRFRGESTGFLRLLGFSATMA